MSNLLIGIALVIIIIAILWASGVIGLVLLICGPRGKMKDGTTGVDLTPGPWLEG